MARGIIPVRQKARRSSSVPFQKTIWWGGASAEDGFVADRFAGEAGESPFNPVAIRMLSSAILRPFVAARQPASIIIVSLPGKQPCNVTLPDRDAPHAQRRIGAA